MSIKGGVNIIVHVGSAVNGRVGLFLSNLTYALFMFFTYLGLFMFPLFGL